MSIYNLPIKVYRDTDTWIAECFQIKWAKAYGNSPEEAMTELWYVIEMLWDQQEDLRFFATNINSIFTYLPISVKWVNLQI